MFTFLYGLRFRLFLLLGLALLPLLGLTLRTASAQRELAAAQAKTEALRMTRLVVSNQNTLTAGGGWLEVCRECKVYRVRSIPPRRGYRLPGAAGLRTAPWQQANHFDRLSTSALAVIGELVGVEASG